ncbi:CoA-binding protein [Neobacillus niacini]|uniref:acetate--CoA ligase family protein n=1 Tax=Neobacillus niacini TaxID=86668 RepID=UPI002FFE850D
MSFTKMNTLSVNLDAAFKPKSIAIIGASNDRKKLGGADMSVLIESGFEGEIYPINTKESLVQGYKAYKTVLEVPDEIDRATIILPTRFVLNAVKECAEKGIKVVQIYSAGFGEFGEEGRKIEEEMVDIARKHSMSIVGPNCIGTFCPLGKISFARGTSMTLGSVAFVSQSGGIAFDMVNRGNVQGIHYSKVISVGNCIDLDHADYLQYLSDDEDTKVIGLYIESVKDGQKFLKTLKEATKKKPVIILKGGRTESGSQSVASHTGNLAGSYQIWEALFEQTGAIQVKSIEEMLTVLLAFQELKPYSLGSVALIGNGGGATVLATDYLEEVELHLAKLTNQTHFTLSDLGVSSNGRNANPIDLPAYELALNDCNLFGDIIRAYSKDEEVKYILFHLNLIPFAQYFDLEGILEKFMNQLVTVDLSTVNLIGVFRSNEDPGIEVKRHAAVKKLQSKGIPIFRTIEQAAFGISTVTKSMKTDRRSSCEGPAGYESVE